MKKIFSSLALAVALGPVLPAAADTWTAPIGIPVPQFGIKDTHLMYSGNAGYLDAGNGPYTIYVDNSHPDCTDSGPGTEAKPRCEIPDSIPEPGTVVEVHGGPYDYETVKTVIDANGSQDRPVFLRGVDDGAGFPVIDNADTFAVQGQYFIVENLLFTRTSVRTGSPGAPPYGRHHISLRNLEISKHDSKNASGLGGEHIVFYRNHVHHNFGDDRHGTTVGMGSDHVWIVDNYFHHNGGDAVQFCHRCRKDPPRNVFVGRNLMHSDRENAVDLKFGENIVISENTMYGYKIARPDTEWCFDDNSYCGKFSSGSDGSAIVIGSDGAPKNPWILYNNIFDSAQGIRVEEVASAWIIGNTIHNISMRAIPLQKNGDPLYIIGNAIFNAKNGIDQYWRKNFSLQIYGNIFSNVNDLTLNIDGSVTANSKIANNVFWRDDGKIRIHWGRGQSAVPTPGNFDIRGGVGNVIANPDISADENGKVQWRRDPANTQSVNERIAEQDIEFKSQFGSDVTILRPNLRSSD